MTIRFLTRCVVGLLLPIPPNPSGYRKILSVERGMLSRYFEWLEDVEYDEKMRKEADEE